eukprot:GHVO01006127.1.p3 GENE.GHVO01006127.1~~GHVO01006127.1.p3  ORF type:complete len:113 (+),score=12.92 GHVO01006127.1:319-657(+)
MIGVGGGVVAKIAEVKVITEVEVAARSRARQPIPNQILPMQIHDQNPQVTPVLIAPIQTTRARDTTPTFKAIEAVDRIEEEEEDAVVENLRRPPINSATSRLHPRHRRIERR